MGHWSVVRRHEAEEWVFGFQRSPWFGRTIYMLWLGRIGLSSVREGQQRRLVAFFARFVWLWHVTKIGRDTIFAFGPFSFHWRRR